MVVVERDRRLGRGVVRRPWSVTVNSNVCVRIVRTKRHRLGGLTVTSAIRIGGVTAHDRVMVTVPVGAACSVKL